MQTTSNKKTVVLGLSGGVDSAVSALLLQERGFNVIGVYMQNWDKEINGDLLGSKINPELGCSSIQDFKDAKEVADQLNIKLIKLNFVKEYWDLVFQSVLNEYKQYLTPNPDILCNRYIKFGVLLKYVKQHYPDAYFATGHYAKLEYINNQNVLMIPKDEHKDQTYFLCDLTNQQLDNVIFPLSDLYKSQVREIARQHNLIVASKKDSTGICFIGERDFKAFLQNYLPQNEGDIVLVPEMKVIGKHEGLAFYTIGQRQGLNVGGTKERLFVIGKDVKANKLLVTYESNKSKYLTSNWVHLSNFNWINPLDERHQDNKQYYVRFRHCQQLVPCYIKSVNNTDVQLSYPQGSVAITPGQYGAIYTTDKICLGGGKIIEAKME